MIQDSYFVQLMDWSEGVWEKPHRFSEPKGKAFTLTQMNGRWLPKRTDNHKALPSDVILKQTGRKQTIMVVSPQSMVHPSHIPSRSLYTSVMMERPRCKGLKGSNRCSLAALARQRRSLRSFAWSTDRFQEASQSSKQSLVLPFETARAVLRLMCEGSAMPEAMLCRERRASRQLRRQLPSGLQSSSRTRTRKRP